MSYFCNIYDRDQQSIARMTIGPYVRTVQNKYVILRYHFDVAQNSAEINNKTSKTHAGEFS